MEKIRTEELYSFESGQELLDFVVKKNAYVTRNASATRPMQDVTIEFADLIEHKDEVLFPNGRLNEAIFLLFFPIDEFVGHLMIDENQPEQGEE